MKKENLILVLIILLNFIILNSTVINIPDDELTIQAGVNSSVDGDTILVHPGTYYENINFNGKAIIVSSLILMNNDIKNIYQTIIDGSNSNPSITFENGEDLNSIINGVIIQNGFSDYGGGIYCANSNPTISNSIIQNNHAGLSIYSGGAGIYCENSNPYIYNSLISNNSSNYYAGGIYCNLSNPTLNQVILENNSANNDGGAIYCKESNPILINITIAENTSSIGGGIYCFQNSNPILQNTIIWNNFPQGICFSPSNTSNSITILYCDLQNGESGIVINNNGIVNWGNGNIEDNPDFVLADNFNTTTNSSCINSGNPDLDNDSFNWENDIDDQDPDGSRMDIGANLVYDYQFDFTTNDNFGYVEYEANFEINSEGFIFDYFWDFENDGIYDSALQNPSHTYTQAGIYDVKLKVMLNSWHSYSDSLIISNLIVVQGSQLEPPENLTINLCDNDVILQWTSVIEATYYLIYSSSNLNLKYEFVDYTDNNTTNFTHSGIINQKDKLFYVVIAYDGSWDELNKYLESNKKHMKINK